MSEQAEMMQALIHDLHSISDIEILMQTLNSRRAILKRRERLAKELSLDKP